VKGEVYSFTNLFCVIFIMWSETPELTDVCIICAYTHAGKG